MRLAAVQLLRSAANGDLNRLRELVAQGVDINTTTKANQTALMLAVAFNRIEVVEYLVLAGADVKVHDELGLTAADWARQDVRIIRLLNPPHVDVVSQQTQSARLDGLAGAIHRDHTAVNSAFAVARGPEAPMMVDRSSAATCETAEEALNRERPKSADHATVPDAPAKAPARVVQPPAEPESDDIPLSHVHSTSPGMRALVRVSIVVLLVIGSFGAYYFVTSVLSSRTSRVEPKPAPPSANAALNLTKSGPAIGGALAGTELFLPDAQYPPDAVAAGNVTVGIQVSRKGVVVKVEALDGDESLRSAAEKAAWSSAFAPEKLVDTSELIDGTITYSFSKPDVSKPQYGFIDDANTRRNVSATVGGPLAGAERKLVIPKIPKWVTVEQESATVVVRVTKSGRVMSFRPLDAEERLRPYLVRAARSSTFDPSKLSSDGQVVGIITYKFQ